MFSPSAANKRARPLLHPQPLWGPGVPPPSCLAPRDSLERPHLDAAQQPGNLGLTTRAATTDLGDDAAIAEGRALGESSRVSPQLRRPGHRGPLGSRVRSRVEGARVLEETGAVQGISL